MKWMLYLLLFCLADCVVSESYLVTPSSDIPCRDKEEDQPCLTLSQYATKPRDYFNKTLSTFFIQSGDHYLLKTFSLQNMKDVLFIVEEPADTKITCLQSARFKFHDITGNLLLQRLTLFKCGGNTVSFVHSLVMGTCNFYGQGGSDGGPALDITYTNQAYITECRFVSNTGKKILPGSSREATAGGAIIANSSNLQIVDSLFRDNKANVGGALFFMNGSVTIDNGTFSNNQASNKDTQSDCRGGAIYVEEPRGFYTTTTITIERSYFTENSASGTGMCRGGGLFTQEVSRATINGSSFFNNSAEVEGGGTYIKAGKAMISFSDFSYNQAVFLDTGRGGGLFFASITSVSTITIDSCTFSYNSVPEKGGGFASLSDNWNTITTVNSIFYNNTAGDSGGGIFTYRVLANITGSTFMQNYAYAEGAALWTGGSVKLRDLKFFANMGDLKMFTPLIKIIEESVFYSEGFLTIQDNVVGSVLMIAKRFAMISGHTLISNNTGSVLLLSANATFDGVTEFVDNTYIPYPNNTIPVAAAITCIGGGVTLKGNTTFLYNSGMHGGPIYATQANISISGDITIAYLGAV